MMGIDMLLTQRRIADVFLIHSFRYEPDIWVMNISTQTIISNEFISLKSHNTLSYVYRNIICCYYS
jgi:hypothetical protein